MAQLSYEEWKQKFEEKKCLIIQEWENSNITYDLIVRLIKNVPKHSGAKVRDVNAFNRLRDYKHKTNGLGQGYFENIQIYDMDMILKWKKILNY